LDEAARLGFGNGAFEESEEELPAIQEEFSQKVVVAQNPKARCIHFQNREDLASRKSLKTEPPKQAQLRLHLRSACMGIFFSLPCCRDRPEVNASGRQLIIEINFTLSKGSAGLISINQTTMP